jgi:quercetin dioxygenase-like cupin family protein
MEFVSGNIFIREGLLSAGDTTPGHAHNFDHTTYVPRGAIRFEKLGEPIAWSTSLDRKTGEPIKVETDWEVLNTVEKHAGPRSWVLIKAGVKHRLTAIEDSVYHCIYSHRTPQGEIVQEYDGWQPAYL